MNAALYVQMMKLWSEVKDDFRPDGALRDIYVSGITESDWDVFLNEIASAGFPFAFTHGESETRFPRSFRYVRELQKTEPTTLKIWLKHGIQVNCHFFMESEIEMDIAPREIAGSAEYDALVSFLRWIAEALDRPVALTHENSPDQEILRIDRKSI